MKYASGASCVCSFLGDCFTDVPQKRRLNCFCLLSLSIVILGLYRGYIGILEKKMETLGPFKGLYRGYISPRHGSNFKASCLAQATVDTLLKSFSRSVAGRQQLRRPCQGNMGDSQVLP